MSYTNFSSKSEAKLGLNMCKEINICDIVGYLLKLKRAIYVKNNVRVVFMFSYITLARVTD